MKIRTSLREALTDENLLGKALPGPSWHTWRTILLATMGEPLTDEELETFQAVTGREQAPTEPCEEVIGIVGRRGGKSRAEAVQAAYLATLVDYSDVLAPGERGLVLCIAPDIRQASIVHSYIAANIDQSPALKPLLESSTQTTLRLTNGIDIEVRSASFRRLRGITCVACIADEVVLLVQRRKLSQPRQRNPAGGPADLGDDAWAAHPHLHALQQAWRNLGSVQP